VDNTGTQFAISILTASLNALSDLERTVESIRSQTYRNYEHIIVDGGSTDGTPGFLTSLHDHSMRWISERDSGIAEAMNKAIRLADGDYLLVLQAGDTFLNDCSLAEAVRYIDGMTDIISFAVQLIDGDHSVTADHNNLMRRFGLKTPLPHQGCFIKRKLFSRIGLYDESYRIVFDYDFELRALRAGCSVKRFPVVITTMPKGGISTLTDRRLGEERRVQFTHSPSAGHKILLWIYWPLYLFYRYSRRGIEIFLRTMIRGRN
jgi:glycosyltransferase involved in cell wall biosynthesis